MKYIPLEKQPNVSRTPFEVSSPSMRLDGRGYPHIVWTENKLGKNEINYSYWDGLKWSYKGLPKVSDVIEGTVSARSSLILDTSENPYIAYAKKGTSTILTLASYYNGWNFNELAVGYDVGWVGISHFGGDNDGNSSSSSSSLDSSSSSSGNSSSYNEVIVVTVYDETNFMLKVYLLTDTTWRLIGSKSVDIGDTDSLIIEMAEAQLSIIYVDGNTVKYNFFNVGSLTWAFADFTDVESIQGTIIDIDMDAYIYSGTAYISIGCLSSSDSISYVSNVICSESGVETYYEIDATSYDITIPSDYVVGNRNVAVKVNASIVYQLVTGAASKLYSANGTPALLTWDSGEIVSLDCTGDDLIPIAVNMEYVDGTKIAVQSDSQDIYFLEGVADTKTITAPNMTVLNNKWVLNAEYVDGELVGDDVSGTYNSKCGGILKDSKGYIAVVDTMTNAPSS